MLIGPGEEEGAGAVPGARDTSWDRITEGFAHHQARAQEAIAVSIDTLVTPLEPLRRAGISSEHVHLLAGLLENLPPILVHRQTMSVIDGMHRIHAAKRRGIKEIRVEFFDGSTEEAYLLAIKSNIAHGLALSLADRKAAALRVLRCWPLWSDRAIADRTGLDHKTVGALRHRATGEIPQLPRVGRDGRIRPCAAREGRKIAVDLLRDQPGMALREVARAAGISLSTAKDVRRRLARGLDVDRNGEVGRAVRPSVGSARRETSVERWAAARILRADPSVRSTGAGRTLLRALEAHVRPETSWDCLADNLPRHCIDAIVELAEQCAQEWRQLATRLAARRALQDTA
ncbi:MAG TPA: ParB N-terminal domain-containing protein [Chloroflexota bacterium]